MLKIRYAKNTYGPKCQNTHGPKVWLLDTYGHGPMALGAWAAGRPAAWPPAANQCPASVQECPDEPGSARRKGIEIAPRNGNNGNHIIGNLNRCAKIAVPPRRSRRMITGVNVFSRLDLGKVRQK